MITTKTVTGPIEELFRSERVSCLCHGEPVTVFPQTTLGETLRRLCGDSGGCVVVVKAEGKCLKPVGIFTERDYLDKLADKMAMAQPLHKGKEKAIVDRSTPTFNLENSPIQNFMTPNPKTLSHKESLDTAIQLMTSGGYRHLPLVDPEGNLVGILSARNIISYLAEFFPVEIINLPPRHDQKIGSREGC